MARFAVGRSIAGRPSATHASTHANTGRMTACSFDRYATIVPATSSAMPNRAPRNRRAMPSPASSTPSAHRRSVRPEIHATHSAFVGWIANSAAAANAGQVDASQRRSATNTRTQTAACIIRFVRWNTSWPVRQLPVERVRGGDERTPVATWWFPAVLPVTFQKSLVNQRANQCSRWMYGLSTISG